MSQHGYPERLSNGYSFQEEEASQPTMEVLVETLTGTAFELTVSPSDTVFAIKSKIFRVEGIPVSQQHLLYNLKELDDSSSLRSQSISGGARLRLVLGLRGGPISTRRLPPPPAYLQDIERLFDTNRDEASWSGGGGGGGGGEGGCKVTVLVFRDGERVNMLRVRENDDGTYSPLHRTSHYSSASLKKESSSDDDLSGVLQENAVTMGKMIELRRRMESLSVHRNSRPDSTRGDKPEPIQKTRSEETLSVPSLLDENLDSFKSYTPYSDEDAFPPLYDGNYTRYDYDCLPDRYTYLPPIAARTSSNQSIETISDEKLKLSDALAGSILVKSGRREDDSMLEEGVCLDGGGEASVPSSDYGPLAVGEGRSWRVRGFGSSSQLAPPAPLAASAHSASSLQLRAPAPPPRPPRAAPLPPPIATALFSSSTSDLEQLKRSRLLPALSRHRNREHLHLSDERLDLPRSALCASSSLEVGSERRQRRIKKIAELETQVTPQPPPEPPKELKKMKIRCGFCRKKLSIATVHTCRCGAEFCAPHRYAEVHGCAYDYKAGAGTLLQRANPLVSAPKLPKI